MRKVDFVREDVSADLHARLARIDAVIHELLDLSRERSNRQEQLGRELIEERAKILEIQRKIVPTENALLSAQDRVAELEEALPAANRRADEAERDLFAARTRIAELEQASASLQAELERDLSAARDRIAELERTSAKLQAELEQASASLQAELERASASLRKDRDDTARANERAQARIAALEAQVADISGDLAEREHLAEELQQALRYERDQRKLREAERDRLRELFGYLQKSRWRRLGQLIGVVKTREWERLGEE